MPPQEQEVYTKFQKIQADGSSEGAPKELFVDGSAKDVGTLMATGGAAVVYKDVEGNWQTVSWSSPRAEVLRESGAMELVALLIALRQLEAGGWYVIWTDCKMVHTGWKRLHDRKQVCMWSEGASKYDGLWRCIAEECNKLEQATTAVEVRKIKAHRNQEDVGQRQADGEVISEAELEVELERWDGNRRADLAAKEAGARGAYTRLQRDDFEEVNDVVDFLAKNWCRLSKMRRTVWGFPWPLRKG